MRNQKIIKLQLFADPAPAEPEADPEPQQAEADATKQEPENDTKQEAKYTDEDVDRIFSRKFAEWEKKQQKKVDEAKRLGEMNAQQKAEYERDQLEKKVEELMRKNTLTEMSKSARAMLSEKNINVNDELLGMLVSDDADQTKTAVDSFVALFQDAVKKAVTDALKGDVPKTGSASTGATREDIMKVTNRAERQRLIKENMQLFQK